MFMAKRVRLFVSLIVMLVLAVSLVGCGHYTCGITFGNSTCGSGGSGGSGGGGTSTANAFAYAVDQNGSMDGYALNVTANTFGTVSTFTPPVIPANKGGVGVVVAQGKYIYAVLEDVQKIFGWSIGTNGSLTALTGFPLSLPSLSGISGYSYNQQVVITNPAGTLMFIAEATSEQIVAYQISSSGALTAVSGSPFSTAAVSLAPQNMGMDGLGRFLYVSQASSTHAGTTIVGYSVSSTGTNTGALTLISGSPFNIPLWQMEGDPSGNYLIGISGKTQSIDGSDDKNLYVYSINQTTGALTAAPGSPMATVFAPFNIAIQPKSVNGEFIYSFSLDDAGTGTNPIEAYKLDPASGALSLVTGSPFSLPTPTAFGQFDQSGNYLFIYSGSGSSVSLGVVNVASSGALTETLPATPLVTSGYFAPSDVP
jgi:6-phosphogluconolactonase (cycloisomerase 2 family)